MMIRSSLISGNVRTAAAGILLLALIGASLGCAMAACFGVTDRLPAPAHNAATLQDKPGALASALVGQPIARVGEAARCVPTQAARTRRLGHNACRLAELPSV